MKFLVTYSKLRGRVLGYPFVKTLDELISEIFEKYSGKNRVSSIESECILSRIIGSETLQFYHYLNENHLQTVRDMAGFFVSVKRNRVEIERLDFPAQKRADLMRLFDAYNGFLEKHSLGDTGDAELFAAEYLKERRMEVYADNFYEEKIHFFTSKLQKEAFDALDKEAVEEKVEPKQQKRWLVESFDIYEEVSHALKLARDLGDAKIVVSDLDAYYEVFEALGYEYGLQLHSTKGDPLAKVLHRFPEKRRWIAQKASLMQQKFRHYGLEIPLDEIKKLLLQSERVLERRGVEITETNQIFLYNDVKNLIFVGASFDKFPPSKSKSIFYQKNHRELFFENDTFESSVSIYERMKRVADNLYVIYQKNEITKKDLSIIIDPSDFEKKRIVHQKHEISVPKEDDTPTCPVEVNRLSASKINTYRNCPRQYYYTYILDLAEPEMEETEMDVMLKGRIMHKAFEMIMNDKMQGSTFKPSLEYVEAAYSDLEVEENLFTDLYRHELERMCEKFKRYALEVQNALTEKDIYLDEALRPCGEEGHFIHGVIDRIDINDEVTIVDYKSSKKERTDGEKVEKMVALRDVQLGLYCLWAKRFYDKPVHASLVTFNTEKEYVEFATLKECDEPKYVRKYPKHACYNEVYERELEDVVMEVKQKIESGEFAIGADAECTWCAYTKICDGKA